MKRTLLIILSMLFAIMFKYGVEASEDTSIIYDYEVELYVGDSVSLNSLFDNYNYEDPVYGISNESFARIEGNNLIAYNPGIVCVYVDYSYNGIQVTDFCKVKISIKSGYYKIYTLDENLTKKYLTITDIYPEGSSLCLESKNEMVTGIDKFCQIWRVEEIIGITEPKYYKLSLAASLDSYIKLDGDTGLVYLEQTGSNEDYGYKKWYFESDTNGIIIKSNKMSNVRALHYDLSNNIIYSEYDSENAQKWFFEIADSQMRPFMRLYDMYGSSYSQVEERWMALNTTKTLEDLEIFPAICSSSSTKEEIRWKSSDETIATVDETTGKVTSFCKGTVTITADAVNDDITDKSYILHVEDFEEGLYYLKNTVNNMFLSAESTEIGSTIVTKNTVESTNIKWKIKVHPDGKYGLYLLNSANERLYLSLNEENQLVISQYDGVSAPWYRDTAIWDLVITHSDYNECTIGIPYIEDENEYYNYISINNGSNNVSFENPSNPFYYWEFIQIDEQEYVQIIDFCYDNAFEQRTHFNVLDDCKSALANEYLDEFGLELIINIKEVESFADVCKNINGLSYSAMCPGNPCITESTCTNMKSQAPDYYGELNGSIDCTDDAVVSWEFRPYSDVDYEIPAALFCGHNLYDDDGSSKNRSYYNPGNETAMILCVDSDASGYCGTVIHEFGHCFGANDHYHVPSSDGTVQNCGRGVKCSVCGVGAHRRSKNCMMNSTTMSDYEWCEDCRFDIEFKLSNMFDL